MTACVNKKHTRRVALAISASLVGSLSLGAAAPVAFANDGISALDVASEHEAYYRGSAATYTIGGVEKDYDGPVTVKKSELDKSAIKVASVDLAVEGTEPVKPEGGTFYYKKCTVDEGGDHLINGEHYAYAGMDFSALGVGEYIAVTAYQSGDKIGNSEDGAFHTAPAVEFSVVADDLTGAKVMKEFSDGTGTDDISYDATQKWQDLRIFIDGQKIQGANFEVYNKIDTEEAIDQSGTILPGDYVIIIKGNSGSDYAGAEPVRQELTVSKLDLSSLDLYLEDVESGEAAPTIDSLMGADVVKLGEKEGLALSITGKTWATDGLGEYEFVLKADPESDGYKTASSLYDGELKLTVNKVDENAKKVEWSYDNHALAGVDTIILDRSAQADNFGSWVLKSFDTSKISGTYTDANKNEQKVTGDQLKVTVTDSEGNEVTDLATAKKGVYTVTVEAVSSEFGYKVARSTIQFDLNVKSGMIGQADTTFTYGGKVVNSLGNLTYDGDDYLDRIGVTVTSGGKTLVEGADYTVTVKKDGKVVDGIVDAGVYEIIVSSDYYQIGDSYSATDKLEVTVSPVTLTDISFDRASAPFKTFYDMDMEATTAIPYAGSMIESPVVTYEIDRDGDGKMETEVLPSDCYTITWTLRDGNKKVDGLSAVGTYDAVITLNEGVVNYEADAELKEACRVLKDMPTGFVDVHDEAWYAESVNKAKVNGYIKGVSGTEMYAPERSISRADAVVILARMAGMDEQLNEMDENQFSKEYGYYLDYSDVDEGAYYAKAIAWATKVDIAHGDANADTFRPEDPVTREEFAALLYNYAKAVGNDSSIEGDLSGVNGAETVSPWMTEAVTWAYEHNVMGNNGASLNGHGDITRAETAAMAQNYQAGKFAE